MSRIIAAGFFTALLIVSAGMGGYSAVTAPELGGFTDLALAPPGDSAPEPLGPVPDAAGSIQSTPGISAMIYIGGIYAQYGGSVRLNVTNNDTRPIFLEEAGLTWTGSGDMYTIQVHEEIQPGETYEIPAMAIGGPALAGTHEYRLSMKMLQRRNDQWLRVIGPSDDWVMFAPHNMDVLGLSEEGWNGVSLNPRAYYTRVNDIVDFGTGPVANATANATAGMGEGFTVAKACAIFDWLDSNLDYREDPGGGDAWYSPDETLSSGAGDCEDYAMLLAAMTDFAGGYARIYLTTDHAFAAVYAGNTTSDLENATEAIRAYYGTDVPVHSFPDEKGHWVIADPLGSFHLGGPAVGMAPTEQHNGTWNFTFEESDDLFAIDVIGEDVSRGLWLDVNFWMGMMLVFGFLGFGFMLSARSEVRANKVLCHICAREIAEDPYVCPTCKTTYHRPCIFEKGWCMTCGKPAAYPPPPGNLKP